MKREDRINEVLADLTSGRESIFIGGDGCQYQIRHSANPARYELNRYVSPVRQYQLASSSDVFKLLQIVFS